MPTLKSLEDQGLALVTQQKALLDDPRPWSAKKAEFAKLDKDLSAVVEQATVLKSVDGSPFEQLNDRVLPGAMSPLHAAYGKAIDSPRISLEPDEVEQLREAGLSMKSLAITCKAQDSTAITPAGIRDYRLPPVTVRREPTRVLDLLPKTATDKATVTYYTTTGTTAANAVAEGGAKPQSTLSYTAVDAKATKIAHYVEVTDETLSDFPAFMQALQGDMQAGLIKAENAELLTATVTGAHYFPGLLNASGILTRVKSTEISIDTIALAFDDLRNGTSFTEPDGIVMHPTDWGLLRRLKDANQRYYIDMDPSKVAPVALWGKPVVLTTQITQGTALVGNFSEGAMAFIREGIRVETANQGTTQFTTNTTLVRAEERLTLGVIRPTCFVKVTGL